MIAKDDPAPTEAPPIPSPAPVRDSKAARTQERDALHRAAPSRLGFAVVAIALTPALGLGGNRIAVWALAALAALALLSAAALRFPIRAPRAPSALWVCVMSWAVVQAVALSPAPDESWRAAARLGLYAAVFVLAFAARPGGGAMRWTAFWCAALSAYGLWAWSVGENPIVGALEAYPEALESSFAHRSSFALYAGIGAVAALGAFAAGMKPTWRGAARRFAENGWFWVALGALGLVAVALAGSRGGAAATAIGLAAFAAAYDRRLLVPAASAAVVIAAAPYLIAPDRVDLLSDERGPIYAAALRGVMDAPWSGHGVGAFRDAFRPYAASEWRWGDWDHAHNAYLEAAFELGLPAAAAKIAAVALLAGGCFRRAREGGARSARAAVAFAAIVAAGAHGFVDLSLSIPAIPLALALLAGAALAPPRRRRRNRTSA